MNLENILKVEDIDMSSYHYILKGDISGIQDFIFNTKSEGASKTLKSKSFYVQAISEMCVDYISKSLNSKLLYNSGGNFYLFVERNEDKLESIKKRIEKSFRHDEIYVTISWVKNDSINFEVTKGNLEKKSSLDKLQKFNSIGLMAFEAFDNIYRKKEDWKGFAETLVKNSGFLITKDSKKEGVFRDYLQKFDNEYEFSDIATQFNDRIINKLPRWKNKFDDLNLEIDNEIKSSSIIDFETLANFAKLRTGTEKIGVLKMDIDFLGNLFKECKTIKETQILSNAFTWFFESRILELLQKNISHPEEIIEIDKNQFEIAYNNTLFNYLDNIYVVFSGGDDCFLLGAWDSVFEFAIILQQDFDVFQKNLRKNYLPTISNDITLSASLILVDSSYPVNRFAHLAEDALAEAKTFKYNHETQSSKNKVNIFGQILTWGEVRLSKNIADQLKNLIYEKSESRSVIERIKNSSKGFEHLQNKASNGKIHFSSVWRLKYYLRNAKNKKEMEDIFNQYIAAIMKSIGKQQTTNPETFRVAARWAEFLTRKQFTIQKLTTINHD